MTVTEAEIKHVFELELEVQSSAARSSAVRLLEPLATTFIEIGTSGRRWDIDATLDLLAQESADPDVQVIGINGLEARVLCADVVQVFWDSDRDGRRTRRTSLWQRTRRRTIVNAALVLRAWWSCVLCRLPPAVLSPPRGRVAGSDSDG